MFETRKEAQQLHFRQRNAQRFMRFRITNLRTRLGVDCGVAVAVPTVAVATVAVAAGAVPSPDLVPPLPLVTPAAAEGVASPSLSLSSLVQRYTEVEKMACMWFGEICYCCS